jgi:hypothetical protein
MMPENAERRPRQEGGAGGDAGNVGLIVAAAASTGCPCGCRRSAWYADPDCVTRQPMPAAHDWPVSSVELLGLIPHHRRTCSSCQAVGT